MGRNKSHRKKENYKKIGDVNPQTIAEELYKKGIISKHQAFGHLMWDKKLDQKLNRKYQLQQG